LGGARMEGGSRREGVGTERVSRGGLHSRGRVTVGLAAVLLLLLLLLKLLKLV